MQSLIEDGAVVLFQGDSITDAERNRSDGDNLGSGYALMASSWFQALYPEKKVRFINRGISGNRVQDLLERWQEDCLDLRPNLVSIMIGINDTWRRYDQGDTTSTERFEAVYRALLKSTTSQFNVRLILCEPFVLPVPPDRRVWREDLDPKIDVVRRLAREFQARLVPFDGIFAQASARWEPGFWAHDGVHPSPAGHALMAQAWLRTVGAI